MRQKVNLSRRAFLRAGAMTAAGWTVGRVASAWTPTAAGDEPNGHVLSLRPARADLIVRYPRAARSVVAIVRHGGALDGDRVVKTAVLRMLDAAITQLTGLNDALAAWQALFDPAETVGIKVNAGSRYATSPEVACAVAQRLQEAGLPAERIVIFDRSVHELSQRGFGVNPDGPGVRCQGVGEWAHPHDVAGVTQRLHDVLERCDALINIPSVKEHPMCGLTSALKNHYGSVAQPGLLHDHNGDPYIPALNALPIIRDKTRLIVCDALRICPYDWDHMTPECTLMMSFDPVANDLLARRLVLDRRAADGRPGEYIEKRSHYLQTAVEMGLGADEGHIERRQLVLSPIS